MICDLIPGEDLRNNGDSLQYGPWLRAAQEKSPSWSVESVREKSGLRKEDGHTSKLIARVSEGRVGTKSIAPSSSSRDEVTSPLKLKSRGDNIKEATEKTGGSETVGTTLRKGDLFDVEVVPETQMEVDVMRRADTGKEMAIAQSSIGTLLADSKPSKVDATKGRTGKTWKKRARKDKPDEIGESEIRSTVSEKRGPDDIVSVDSMEDGKKPRSEALVDTTALSFTVVAAA